MSDQIILKNVDDQAGGTDYKFILRVTSEQGFYLTAVDDIEIAENGIMMIATRGGKIVTMFSVDLSFTLSAREDFITKTRLELYEEELEVQVEANKFGTNAKRILGIKDEPHSGYQE